MTPISIVKLVNNLTVDIAEKLGKRVDDCYWGRLLHERLARKTLAEEDYCEVARLASSAEVDLDGLSSGLGNVEKQDSSISEPFARQNSMTSVLTDGSFGGDNEPNRSVIFQELSSVASLNPVDKAIDAFLAMKMEDMDEFGNTVTKPVVISEDELRQGQQIVKSGAATAIQRLARGADARAVADKRHHAKVTNQIREVLCEDVFVSTAAAVLHNTIYNLLQEASYGEFSLEADPLKYMLKQRDDSAISTGK